MRRVIAATSNFTDTGDITTLANPEIVEKIRQQVQTAKRAKGEAPKELSETELNEIKNFGAE
jgi:acetyl-CoA synthetase